MNDIIKPVVVDFEVVKGGKPKELSSTKESDLIKVVLGGLRSAENALAEIKNPSGKMKDKELNDKIHDCHRVIFDTLKYIKQTRSDFNNRKSGNLTLV
jgi:hypothetical protein